MTDGKTLLETKLDERNRCRSNLLTLRSSFREKTQLVITVTGEAEKLAASIVRESSRLTDLTTECAQLLHADLAGVAPKPKKVDSQPPAVTEPPSA